jgi:catechol 2,3-dioxygenase-like lactoylglutathione lyase family enzyme
MKNGAKRPLQGARLVGFAVTTDAARCRAFYEGKLGLRVQSDDALALVFDAHGSMVRIQKARGHEPRPYTVLGWNVGDIEATVAALVAAGVVCEQYGFPGQDARGIASFPGGDRVAWFKDPDGNVLSVAQLV